MYEYKLADMPKRMFDPPDAAEFFEGYFRSKDDISNIDYLKIKPARKGLVYRDIRLVFGSNIGGRIHLHIHGDGVACEFGDGVDGGFSAKLWGNSNLEIGDRTTANGLEIWLQEGGSVVLGSDCMCAHEVLLLGGDFHGLFDMSRREQLNGSSSSIVIGSHVWLGRRVILTKNASIQNGSVVAAGSTVTKAFGACCLIGGFLRD